MKTDTASTFTYVTFIRTTPDRLWAAVTEPEFMKKYWFGMHFDTDWKTGSSWRLMFPDGRVADGGEIIEVNPPRRLVLKWGNEWKPELKSEGYSLFTMDLETLDGGVVKLGITHAMDRTESLLIQAVSGGWPRILSNLKSLLEIGETILETSRKEGCTSASSGSK